jgi:hypothetical protein
MKATITLRNFQKKVLKENLRKDFNLSREAERKPRHLALRNETQHNETQNN